MKNTREIALNIMMDIEKTGKFAGPVISSALSANQFMSKQERAFISRLCEGAVEKKIRLDFVVNTFSKTKVNKCKPLIRSVLRLATYEILYMDSVPEEATVSEYVNLTGKRGFKNLKGFVNGVLRSICRGKDQVEFPKATDGESSYLSVKYSVPEELISYLLKTYDGKTLEQILAAGESPRETTIRVNTAKISVDAFAKKLQEEKITVAKGHYNPTSLIISDYDYIRRVPGFHDGLFVVQDESSSLAVLAAGIKDGDTVLDMCAAPGGKTMYAAELAGDSGTVYSRDLTEDKVELIEENVERLELANVKAKVHDATVLEGALVGKCDIVLADLPCSGLGVMARKNDIKYHVTESAIKELAQIQKIILDVAANYVKPGGVLMYSTCTITKEENQDNLFAFLENHREFKLESLAPYLPDKCQELAERGKEGYITLHQGIDKCDGFFMARMVRE